MPEGCAIPGCSGQAEITYLGHGLCADHWDEMTAEEVPSGALRVVLGIPAGPAAAMNEETTMETEAQEKLGKGKGRAKGKDEKTAKSKKPARVEAPEEDLVVFAFRLLLVSDACAFLTADSGPS